MRLLSRLVPGVIRRHWQHSLQPFLSQRYQKWLDRRIPPNKRIELNQKNIFIFLSPAGYGFSALLLLLLLIAINYQNSLVYAFTFLLGSLMVTFSWVSFANFSGLHLSFRNADNCFAGERGRFHFQLQSSKNHYNIHLQWPEEDEQKLNIHSGSLAAVDLFHHCPQRGVYKPGRLKIFSDYPSGLFRTWSWINLDCSILVYPKPVFGIDRIGSGSNSGEELHAKVSTQTDELRSFRKYQAGDNLKQVYWKGLAKGQGLLSKEYEEISSAEEWLDFDNTPGNTLEEKLSIICGWALDCHEQSIRFGCRLPGVEIPCNMGDDHLTRVLSALAMVNHTEA